MGESDVLFIGDILRQLNIMEPGEIAELFRKEGVRGYARNSGCCPMAIYLNRNSGYFNRVHGSFIAIYDIVGNRLGSVDLPQSIQKFVKNYDAGKYLFLDAGRPIE